ncbi:DUF3099 domain-containing protein [Corynebacterium sp. CCM 9204]
MMQRRNEDGIEFDSGDHASIPSEGDRAGRNADGTVVTPDPVVGWRRGLRRLFSSRKNVELITSARQTPLDNLNERRRKYAILQGSRIPFLLASAVTWIWWENTWLSAILFLISVPLPWIAVVIGNGAGEPRDPRTRQVYKPGVAREYHAQQMLAVQRQRELGESPDQGPDNGANDGNAIIEHD